MGRSTEVKNNQPSLRMIKFSNNPIETEFNKFYAIGVLISAPALGKLTTAPPSIAAYRAFVLWELCSLSHRLLANFVCVLSQNIIASNRDGVRHIFINFFV